MKTKVQQYVEGVGGVRMWGFCPAVDLLDVVPTDGADVNDEPINICSLMAGDIGSCLKTMTQMRRRAKARPVNFYLVEKQPEVLARHILLLAIFFDEDLGPRECTEIFLEVYGNTMLRKQTSAYVHNKVEDLVSFLTNGTGVLAGLIDVTSLKFKERDAIEKVFKTWLEDVECDMPAWREKRMRNYFEDRYDYRKNLIDWDYSMSVKDWAEIIHSKVSGSGPRERELVGCGLVWKFVCDARTHASALGSDATGSCSLHTLRVAA
jgi:dynein assembly factor 3